MAVAFSGGLDSTVLAHALVSARRQFAHLRLLHVDHGLQAVSADWAKTCALQARRWRVPFRVLRADIRKKKGESPEAAARDARYALLERELETDEILVTAQHQDDQAETLLLQLFRGAGVAGLAAMPPIATFGRGRIARPLLGESRAALAAYAAKHALTWIDDPTNDQTRFARNYLRHEVLPKIRERWPGVDAALARSAAHVAEAHTQLAHHTRADLNRLADAGGLEAAGLRSLPKARRRAAVRAWLARAGVDAPSTVKLNEIVDRLLDARSDAQPEQGIPGAIVRRRAGRLEVEVKSQQATTHGDETVNKSWDWGSDRECVVTGGTLALVADAAGPIDLDRLPPRLELRARRGGETLRPAARARTKTLKSLLQTAKMSIEERTRLPLLFAGDVLLIAGDRWIDASIAANVKSRRRARLKWSRRGHS